MSKIDLITALVEKNNLKAKDIAVCKPVGDLIGKIDQIERILLPSG